MKDSTLIILAVGGAALLAYFLLRSKQVSTNAALSSYALQTQAVAAQPRNQLVTAGIQAGSSLLQAGIRALTNRSADSGYVPSGASTDYSGGGGLIN